MRMKEDAMGNGQLKPAFNLQHGVDSEYIVWLTIGPQPTDTTTLIHLIFCLSLMNSSDLFSHFYGFSVVQCLFSLNSSDVFTICLIH